MLLTPPVHTDYVQVTGDDGITASLRHDGAQLLRSQWTSKLKVADSIRGHAISSAFPFSPSE